MRPAQLAIMTILLAGPAVAIAAPWNGVTPGTTTQAQVEQRFGEPTKRTRSGARAVLAYFGDHAMEGTKQVQFHVDEAGRVQEITVFLTVPLDQESIEGKYGKPSQKTFIDSTFQKVWVYAAQGVTVYWAKDGSGAEALSFVPAKAGAARPEQARPGAKVEADAARAGGHDAPKGP